MAVPRFTFGPFVLNSESGTLLRQGVPVPVGYRAVLLLRALLENSGEVVSKSVLMDAAWPGMTVEDANLSVQIASLRKLLGPSSAGSDWIATIPRVGYRFCGTVEMLDGSHGAAETPAERGPSIAVLPFVNLTGDIDEQFFADGLTEDTITRLARLRWLFVSARNSSFSYKGKLTDVKQVGRELGVRYVLAGSVRRSGQRLRVNAELSDASSGLQIWANRYDVELTDLFALQDQIGESVIAAIEPRLYAVERDRFENRRPESLDAWGFVMRAMPFVWGWRSAQDIEAAEALLKRAVDIDPEYARANSLLALTCAAGLQGGWVDARAGLVTAAALAQRAVRRDPHDAWAHFAAGYVYAVSRAFERAVGELTEAIDLNPSFAFAHGVLAMAYGYGGLAEDGLHQLMLADRLGPRDFWQAGGLSTRGLCHFMAGRFSEAVECERRAVELQPDFGTAWRTLAAAAGMAGDLEVAANAIAVARRLQPSLSVDWVENYHPIVHARDRLLYIEGLKAAGLP